MRRPHPTIRRNQQEGPAEQVVNPAGHQRSQEAPGVIEAIDLTVRRRGRIVLDAVSFDVRPGQVTGVLGGTGAGKTTLLRRMVQLERGGGETLFDGRPYRSLRHPMREVGVLLDPCVGHPDRTVRGQLRLALATDRRAARDGDDVGGWRRFADRLVVSRRRSPAERIDAVLDIAGLIEHGGTPLSDLTDGMATRLGIALALLGDPRALLFDCPERGLEPEGVAWLGALLRAFTSQGRAALVTGSDTETLVGLADRILLLDSGYLVGTRTTEEVLRAPTGAAVIVRSPQIVRLAAILAEAGARSTQSEGACLEVRGLDRARVGDLAFRHNIPVHELSEHFTGSDPADVVLAACSGRSRPIVPVQGFPELASGAMAGACACACACACASAGCHGHRAGNGSRVVACLDDCIAYRASARVHDRISHRASACVNE
ncbi:ATP-binding cassette domain-containing protein [Actinocrinis sp.]|uniref:ATP-binding cassette domain-containing protein n=1 Tax=Actinocrinis sp. TaxID=1920516 RepID=UPI002DDD4FF6|nr:ATP-binding cassette domain-containing protein [Actinocrinis sp.]